MIELDLTIQFQIDDPETAEQHIFSRKISAKLAQVPRVGELVIIPGPDARSNLQARRVSEVIYSIDGQLVLTFELDGLGNDVDEQAKVLRSAGYLD